MDQETPTTHPLTFPGSRYDFEVGPGIGRSSSPTVAVVAIVDGDRVLVCRRSPGAQWAAGEWEVPGGHVEAGESVTMAAMREVQEETGLNIRITSDLSEGSRLQFFDLRDRPGQYGVMLAAELAPCRCKDGRSHVKLKADEHDAHQWLTIDELQDLAPTPPGMARGVAHVTGMRLEKAMGTFDAWLGEVLEKSWVHAHIRLTKKGKVAQVKSHQRRDRIRHAATPAPHQPHFFAGLEAPEPKSSLPAAGEKLRDGWGEVSHGEVDGKPAAIAEMHDGPYAIAIHADGRAELLTKQYHAETKTKRWHPAKNAHQGEPEKVMAEAERRTAKMLETGSYVSKAPKPEVPAGPMELPPKGKEIDPSLLFKLSDEQAAILRGKAEGFVKLADGVIARRKAAGLPTEVEEHRRAVANGTMGHLDQIAAERKERAEEAAKPPTPAPKEPEPIVLAGEEPTPYDAQLLDLAKGDKSLLPKLRAILADGKIPEEEVAKTIASAISVNRHGTRRRAEMIKPHRALEEAIYAHHHLKEINRRTEERNAKLDKAGVKSTDDPMASISPDSREATLVRELMALGELAYNHDTGLWSMGLRSGRRAIDAVRANGKRLTVGEQRALLERDKATVAAPYRATGQEVPADLLSGREEQVAQWEAAIAAPSKPAAPPAPPAPPAPEPEPEEGKEPKEGIAGAHNTEPGDVLVHRKALGARMVVTKVNGASFTYHLEGSSKEATSTKPFDGEQVHLTAKLREVLDANDARSRAAIAKREEHPDRVRDNVKLLRQQLSTYERMVEKDIPGHIKANYQAAILRVKESLATAEAKLAHLEAGAQPGNDNALGNAGNTTNHPTKPETTPSPMDGLNPKPAAPAVKKVWAPAGQVDLAPGMTVKVPGDLGGGEMVIDKVHPDGGVSLKHRDGVLMGSAYVGPSSIHGLRAFVEETAVRPAPPKPPEVPKPAAPEPEPTPEPGQPKTDDQLLRAQPHELTEPEYQRRSLLQALASSKRRAEGWQKEADKIKAQTKILASDRKKLEQAEMQAGWGKDEFDRLTRDGKQTEREVEKNRARYVETVREAISKGKTVHPAIIEQHPELRKAQDARARYDKGRHTSFGNKSIAVDSSTKEGHGVKVKRQDGKAITPEQTKEITRGLEEIQDAIGPLRDILAHADVTIAHTSGKHPFMTAGAGGMYNRTERTITVGTEVLGNPIRALAHELGHFLDIHAGHSAGKKSSALHGASLKRIDSSSVADYDAGWNADRHDEGQTLISQAKGSINNTREVRRLMKATQKDQKTDEAKAEVERAQVTLGHYWQSPVEVWARLFEQYVATKLGRTNMHAAEDAEAYHEMPGWWKKDDFAPMMPMIEREIARRAAMVRDNMSKAMRSVRLTVRG